MSYFLNLRQHVNGGEPVANVDSIQVLRFEGAVPPSDKSEPVKVCTLASLQKDLRGRDLLLVAHGFNWSWEFGLERLSEWEGWMRLPSSALPLFVLWPGDSAWLHGLDYPAEDSVASQCGKLLADFVSANLTMAASLSFASHSLGARVVLEALRNLPSNAAVRHLILMAAAIDDNSLATDYAGAMQQVGRVTNVRSEKDMVLAAVFPLGNPIAGVFDHTHPYFKGALGRDGPSGFGTDEPWPANLDPSPDMPSYWNYGHHSYMKADWPGADPDPILLSPPLSNGKLPPTGPTANLHNWQQAWAASFTSLCFQSR